MAAAGLDHQRPSALRGDAEAIAGGLPPLQARAARLAATVAFGVHGRRRAGPGENFWQYRRALPGDPAQAIDWRRSGRSDALFVRETEWEAAQTVWIWCDRSAAMEYRSSDDIPRKLDRATEIAAALAILLNRGGERFAIATDDSDAPAARPSTGEAQLARALLALSSAEPREFGAAPSIQGRRGGVAVFISDFFGDLDALQTAVEDASAQGLRGALLQVVDPAEETFPFEGRIVFESARRTLRYETDRADAIRADYQAALAARRDRLSDVARRAGWRETTHRTDRPAPSALLWLTQALADDPRRAGAF